MVKIKFSCHTAAFVVHVDGRVVTLQTHMPQYADPRLWTLKFEDFLRWLGVCATDGKFDDEFVEAYEGLTQVLYARNVGRTRRALDFLAVRTMAFIGVLAF